MQISKGLNDVEAAEILGLKSAQTLRNWRFCKKGPPYYQIGRRIVYQLSDLQEFLEERKIRPEGEPRTV